MSGDSQHAPHEGGVAQVKAIVSAANTVWRRAGGTLGWRQQDLAALIAYWAASNEQYREKETVDWRSHLAEGSGLMCAAYPDMVWRVSGRKVDRRRRYPLEAGPTLLKRARRNLQRTARAVGAEKYAAEYAEDLLENSVEQSTVIVAGTVREPAPLVEPCVETKFLARKVVEACLSGRPGWRNEDQFAVQFVVGYAFSGSERVARAYLKDGLRPYFSITESLLEVAERGISILAGKTCEDAKQSASYYVCAEKYWNHVEQIMRNEPAYMRLDSRSVGMAIAREAIALGDRI